MDKVSKRKVHTVSITIRWYEDEVMADCEHCNQKFNMAMNHQDAGMVASGGELQHRIIKASASLKGKRLLPSDRIVLNALRQRVPKGKQVTIPVRIRDLEAECEISRRQVQICVKRLKERGLIKRLIGDTELGRTGGYQYQLSKDVLSGHHAEVRTLENL